MRICVINPNTTESVTEHVRKEIEKIKRPDTEIIVINPEHGPVSIESVYDELLAAVNTLELVKWANQENFDAILIACFADPGLDAYREVSDIPVFGIEEATLHMAAMLGHRFSIMTGMSRRVPTRDVHINMLGLNQYFASSPAMEMAVLEMDANPAKAKARILELSRKCVKEDRAEVIILGCAGLAGYAEDIENELGVIVLDPTAVGFKVCEAMADLGIRHSKVARYSKPPEKEIK